MNKTRSSLPDSFTSNANPVAVAAGKQDPLVGRTLSGRIAAGMSAGLLYSVVAGVLTITAPLATAAVLDLDFSTSRSLFEDGATAGFDASDTVGITAAGVSYDIGANTGTVNAAIKGRLNAVANTSVELGETASVRLDYVGDGGASSLSSNFGAGVTVGGYIDVCVVPNIFTGGCVTRVSPTFDLIDEGMRLRPDTTFTHEFDRTRSMSDTDNAAGVGSVDLVIGKVGPEVALDISQTSSLRIHSMSGSLLGRHRETGTVFTELFTLNNNDPLSIFTPTLDLAGFWDFDILDLSLSNTFSNLMTLDLRPNINYLVGSWPNSPLAKITLLNESFGLNFGEVDLLNAFSIEVNAPASVDAPAPLFLAGIAALLLLRRRQAVLASTP